MRYMMMIYGDESAFVSIPQEAMMQVMADYDAFHAEMGQRGNLLIAERLHPTPTATTVSVQAGKTLLTDGPFAETKEQLAGIYVFECKDLDEALEIAAKIPSAKFGSVEVRPVLVGPEGGATNSGQ
ncbi:MAG: YciI family protein [Burkholderiales bacterium]|nr:YciI family protein [Anaerolineae bacterium]